MTGQFVNALLKQQSGIDLLLKTRNYGGDGLLDNKSLAFLYSVESRTRNGDDGFQVLVYSFGLGTVIIICLTSLALVG